MRENLRMERRKFTVKTELQGSVDIAYVGGQDDTRGEMGEESGAPSDLFKGNRVGVNLCAVMVIGWPFCN